jgi:hypothetical protein
VAGGALTSSKTMGQLRGVGSKNSN